MKTLKLAAFCLLFLFLALAGFVKGAYDYVAENSAAADAAKTQIYIEPNSSTRQIAQKLLQTGMIKSTFIFRCYIRLLAVDRLLKPGDYNFSGKETLSEVVFQLLKGSLATVRVTIPEGCTINKIACILQDAKVCAAPDFIEAVSDPQLLGSVFSDWHLIPAAEGLVFPDTYYFEKSASAKNAAERMLRLAKHQIDRCFNRPLPCGLTPYEGCVLASIIEKEAAIKSEQAMIASVFYNRLKRKMKLESCATVLYALGKHKSRLLYEDLKVNSPYNTYMHEGLPPTPVANFGVSALEAVAEPISSDYLYFVSDGNRAHKFAKTLAEHNRYKKELFKNRKKNRQNQ